LENFSNNAEEQSRLFGLCRNIDTVAVKFNPDVPHRTVNVRNLIVENVKAQDVAAKLVPVQRVMSMINASAGSMSRLNSGGVFGDPFYSLTTQEEDIYRTFPFAVQVFVQFVLGKYISAKGHRECIERFVYRDEYAPHSGSCLVLENGNNLYFFSAANDNTKHRMTNAQQCELNTKVFSCALDIASARRVDTLIAGAFGIGVFQGNASALACAIDDSIRLFHHPASDNIIDIILAYFLRNGGDDKSKANYAVMEAGFSLTKTTTISPPK
jgi:hypothetical protein